MTAFYQVAIQEHSLIECILENGGMNHVLLGLLVVNVVVRVCLDVTIDLQMTVDLRGAVGGVV